VAAAESSIFGSSKGFNPAISSMGVFVQIDGTGGIHGCKLTMYAAPTERTSRGLVWFEHPEHVQRDRTGEDLSRVGNEIHTMTSDRDGERVPWNGEELPEIKDERVQYLPYRT
jgi:hypothetical protein